MIVFDCYNCKRENEIDEDNIKIVISVTLSKNKPDMYFHIPCQYCRTINKIGVKK
jgi:hypothetical protein